MIFVLIQTISCDAGLRADLWCDTCGFSFDAPSADRRGLDAVWRVASAAGWTATRDTRPARYRCPGCGAENATHDSRLAVVG
jgi:predicted RNA-binding Zn-ribbon protein involved in translation (DUF1610 family)